MKLFIKILLILVAFSINYSFAAINLTVSPIKYELTANTWAIITKTAILHNYGDKDIKITTWKSDFIAWWTDWRPQFVRYSELVHPDQQLSSWISLSSSWFIIPAKSKKEIEFTIKVPENATPGWHYWAVFFKNNNSESSNSNWTSVWINVDYWVIILLKINWEIIINVEIEDNNIVINTNHNKWWYSKSSKNNYNLWKVWKWNNIVKKDNCLLDFTSSRYDWKCFDEPDDIIKIVKWKEEKKAVNKDKNKKEDNFWKDTNSNDFNISFKIPINNKGNTHIKTTWEKTVEWRSWKSYMKYKKWDIITFENSGKNIEKEIKDVIRYSNLEDFLNNEWVNNCLPWIKNIEEAIEIYNKIPWYSKKIDKFWIVAFRF